MKDHGFDMPGFPLYGKGHLVWLAAITLTILIVTINYGKQSEEGKTRIKKFFAWSMIAIELGTDAVHAMYGAPMINYLPLHLCSIAQFAMLIDAYFPKQKVVGQMMAFAFMPGAVAAELFCSWAMYPVISFVSITSFLFHLLIIGYMVMKYSAGEIVPTYKGLWQSILGLTIIAVPIYFFNQAMGTNYLFINSASPGSPLVPLWNMFGTKYGIGGYIAAYAGLAIIVLHVLYFLYSFRVKVSLMKVKGQRAGR